MTFFNCLGLYGAVNEPCLGIFQFWVHLLADSEILQTFSGPSSQGYICPWGALGGCLSYLSPLALLFELSSYSERTF